MVDALRGGKRCGSLGALPLSAPPSKRWLHVGVDFIGRRRPIPTPSPVLLLRPYEEQLLEIPSPLRGTAPSGGRKFALEVSVSSTPRVLAAFALVEVHS